MKSRRDRTSYLNLFHARQWKRERRERKGATLLEVLLATGLFAMGMAALMPLMQGGSRSAMRAELEAMAASRCESALAMYLADRNRSSIAGGTQRMDDKDWNVRIEATPHTRGLQQLTVIAVSRIAPDVGRFELTCLIPQPFDQTMRASDIPSEGVLNE